MEEPAPRKRKPENWWEVKGRRPVIRDKHGRVQLIVPCAGPQITLQSERYSNE